MEKWTYLFSHVPGAAELVFLDLDPVGINECTLVSRSWRDFIEKRILQRFGSANNVVAYKWRYGEVKRVASVTCDTEDLNEMLVLTDEESTFVVSIGFLAPSRVSIWALDKSYACRRSVVHEDKMAVTVLARVFVLGSKIFVVSKYRRKAVAFDKETLSEEVVELPLTDFGVWQFDFHEDVMFVAARRRDDSGPLVIVKRASDDHDFVPFINVELVSDRLLFYVYGLARLITRSLVLLVAGNKTYLHNTKDGTWKTSDSLDMMGKVDVRDDYLVLHGWNFELTLVDVATLTPLVCVGATTKHAKSVVSEGNRELFACVHEIQAPRARERFFRLSVFHVTQRRFVGKLSMTEDTCFGSITHVFVRRNLVLVRSAIGIGVFHADDKQFSFYRRIIIGRHISLWLDNLDSGRFFYQVRPKDSSSEVHVACLVPQRRGSKISRCLQLNQHFAWSFPTLHRFIANYKHHDCVVMNAVHEYVS